MYGKNVGKLSKPVLGAAGVAKGIGKVTKPLGTPRIAKGIGGKAVRPLAPVPKMATKAKMTQGQAMAKGIERAMEKFRK